MTSQDRTLTAERPISDASKLNIERAREALAKARPDAAAAALRSPRPTDLSRLRDSLAQKQKVEARADTFRAGLRAKLGLGEFAGPYSPVAFPTAELLTGQPLCDADICAPAAPPVPEFSRPEAGDPPPPPRPAPAQQTAADVDSVEPLAASENAIRHAGAEPADADLRDLETVESWLSGEADPASRKAEPKPRKRRKLFGLF
jgi:hypothetical protein